MAIDLQKTIGPVKNNVMDFAYWFIAVKRLAEKGNAQPLCDTTTNESLILIVNAIQDLELTFWKDQLPETGPLYTLVQDFQGKEQPPHEYDIKVQEEMRKLIVACAENLSGEKQRYNKEKLRKTLNVLLVMLEQSMES